MLVYTATMVAISMCTDNIVAIYVYKICDNMVQVHICTANIALIYV